MSGPHCSVAGVAYRDVLDVVLAMSRIAIVDWDPCSLFVLLAGETRSLVEEEESRRM